MLLFIYQVLVLWEKGWRIKNYKADVLETSHLEVRNADTSKIVQCWRLSWWTIFSFMHLRHTCGEDFLSHHDYKQMSAPPASDPQIWRECDGMLEIREASQGTRASQHKSNAEKTLRIFIAQMDLNI